MTGEQLAEFYVGLCKDFPINSLIGQVNHFSVNGFMDHLLSLYLCMRWVPGMDFGKLAQRELASTWVGEDMQAHMVEVTCDTVLSSFLKVDSTSMRGGSEHHVKGTPSIEMLSTDLGTREFVNTWVAEDMPAHLVEVTTHDTMLSSFLKVGITSMRCGSVHHVEDTPGIEKLSTDLGAETPTISMLYRIVERDLKNSEFGITKAVRELGRINNLNKALLFDKARPDADSLYVADMRGRASRGGRAAVAHAPPLVQRVRPPRVAGRQLVPPERRAAGRVLPHKRQTGQQLLADVGMVGLWIRRPRGRQTMSALLQ